MDSVVYGCTDGSRFDGQRGGGGRCLHATGAGECTQPLPLYSSMV